MKSTKRVAILGAGPIGIESALRAVLDGYDVTVYEAGQVGEQIRIWDHVEMFSSWSLNRSPWGEQRLRECGNELAPAGDFPTGKSYRGDYLTPLARSLADEIDIRLHTSVLGIARDDTLKGELLADDRRKHSPFIIYLDGPNGEYFAEADIVIDATGVLSNPNHLGPGGLPAIGEEKLNGLLTHRVPDIKGVEGKQYRGRRTLVLGHGHSALTTLELLHGLRKSYPDTEVVWAYRAEDQPRPVIDDDSLPQRARLDRFGNMISRGNVEGIEVLDQATMRQVEKDADGLTVKIRRPGGVKTVEVDRIVANIGFRPDISLYRELQVHLCYASDGPMKLAASLLAQSGNADCLTQDFTGVELLKNPEPDFFILGAKSYGRNSNFLLQIGFEQIDAIFSELK